MRIRSWKCHPDFPLSSDSNFRGCWEFELKSGEQTIPHLHDDGDEISITLEGMGKITVGETSRAIHPGEVVFIPARTSHFIENPSSPLLRGICLETGIDLPISTTEPLSIQDLDDVISSIPSQLDESEALQVIIRLFDVAGHLSEQIEQALGLTSQTGYGALTDIQKQIMQAVVTISENYRGRWSHFPRRF